jgi:hypothetical protein
MGPSGVDKLIPGLLFSCPSLNQFIQFKLSERDKAGLAAALTQLAINVSHDSRDRRCGLFRPIESESATS